MAESKGSVLYHTSVDTAQFGVCELYVGSDMKYRISVSDFYSHMTSVVVLTRKELADAIYAISAFLRGGMPHRASDVDVEVKRIDVNMMLFIKISKEGSWSLELLFYNDGALEDFLMELEKMAVFGEPTFGR